MPLEFDTLHDGGDNESEDLIDDFFTGRMHENGVPGAHIVIGRVQQESQPASGQTPVTKRNLYTVRTTQGHVIPDCILLSSMAYGSFSEYGFPDDKLPGQYSKPYPGAFCVVATSNGGVAFILGFFNLPSLVPTPSDKITSDTNPGSVEDAEARSQGDWICRTEKALINVKRMGAIVIESGATIRQTMNPLNGTHFSQAKFRTDVVEGYRLDRGRISSESPEALSTENFYDKILQRGRKSIRIQIRNGEMADDARHELTISEVDFRTPRDPITTTLARERYFDDGSWIAEGPKYQWGGEDADEPHVLGNSLVDVIKELSRIIKSIKVPTAWGPSGTPLPPTPIDLVKLEQGINKILSDYMFLTKKPESP